MLVWAALQPCYLPIPAPGQGLALCSVGHGDLQPSPAHPQTVPKLLKRKISDTLQTGKFHNERRVPLLRDPGGSHLPCPPQQCPGLALAHLQGALPPVHLPRARGFLGAGRSVFV